MFERNRRTFFAAMGAMGAATVLPDSIARALDIPARRATGSIQDVKHVVILMQENRSFDHYFGAMRGVRGFGDRHTAPLPRNRRIWDQHNGARIRTPFWLNTKSTNGIRIPDTPHTFPDTQAAWNQGRFSEWPKYKTDYSMGYYKREDIPYQYALAEAFTICDAYHCSIFGCTDPNRIVLFSGSNFDPVVARQGVNCGEENAEVYNVRCQITGLMPDPGYSYQGKAFEWSTIPELLEQAGVSWKIYQDPNDNATGLFHGCLAFKSFREARPGSALYERGLRHWSLEQFEQDAKAGALPAVSWILPPGEWSEHPSVSTPIEGAEYVSRVMDALTANPDVWAGTVFLLTFDENDGFFDHVPPPAPPSFNKDGSLAGKATFNLEGEYFHDREGKHLLEADDSTLNTRVWGLGPRVPMLVVSPWSRGGWVNSEVFDHTSVGRFLEKRFNIEVASISPWRRTMCGDLTSCFDFGTEVGGGLPPLPDAKASRVELAKQLLQKNIIPWFAPRGLYQEPGVRPSRALPYCLHVEADLGGEGLELVFVNKGQVGATYHVYDRLHLDRLPRRYAVEADKRIADRWSPEPDGGFDVYVLGPNGFMRRFSATGRPNPLRISTDYDAVAGCVRVTLDNRSSEEVRCLVGADAYGRRPDLEAVTAPMRAQTIIWPVAASQGWYDFSIKGRGFALALAGRVETGRPGVSDPLMFV